MLRAWYAEDSLFDIDFFLSSPLLGKGQLPNNAAGPNCNCIHMANSENGGKSYQHKTTRLVSTASVPNAVRFKDKNFLY